MDPKPQTPKAVDAATLMVNALERIALAQEMQVFATMFALSKTTGQFAYSFPDFATPQSLETVEHELDEYLKDVAHRRGF